MANVIDKTNLGYLDVEFQYKLAKCFIEEPKFFSDIYGIIEQNAFTEPILRNFVGTLKDYYSKEGIVPSYDVTKMMLRSRARLSTDIEEADALIDKLKKTTLEGYSLVKDNALKFFKQQNLIKVANKILEIAGKGDIDRYDECQKLLDDASIAGQEDEYGFNPYDMEDKALSPVYKCSIPTGVSKLDEALNGGLDKGKVGVIIGSAGFGKSTFSTAISSYAATFKHELNDYEGFKVLQIYFEDDDVDVTKKHFSRLTQVEARNLTKDPAQIEEIRRWLDNLPEKEMIKKNLRLKRFNTNTKSATDIENFIKRLTNTGFKPDLVIIDYFECLVPERGGYTTDSKWDREGNTMRKIENMAKDLNVAIWVPTQGNKGSINSSEVVTMDQAGGSIMKVQVAQVVISIARSIEDIDKSRATLALLKNRSGKSGCVWDNIKFDNGRSTISCDEVMEFDNALSYKENSAEKKEAIETNLKRQIFAMHQNDSFTEEKTNDVKVSETSENAKKIFENSKVEGYSDSQIDRGNSNF